MLEISRERERKRYWKLTNEKGSNVAHECIEKKTSAERDHWCSKESGIGNYEKEREKGSNVECRQRGSE